MSGAITAKASHSPSKNGHSMIASFVALCGMVLSLVTYKCRGNMVIGKGFLKFGDWP